MKTRTKYVRIALVIVIAIIHTLSHAQGRENFHLQKAEIPPLIPLTIIVNSNFGDSEDGCDPLDPTWYWSKTDSDSGKFTLSHSEDGAVKFLLQPSFFMFVFRDECDDGDPTWNLAPPFSSIIMRAEEKVLAWPLPEDIEMNIWDIVQNSLKINGRRLDESGKFKPLFEYNQIHLQQEMAKILQTLSMEHDHIRNSLEFGHLPYFILHQKRN